MCQWKRWEFECSHDLLVPSTAKPCTGITLCSPSNDDYDEDVPYGTICWKCSKSHQKPTNPGDARDHWNRIKQGYYAYWQPVTQIYAVRNANPADYLGLQPHLVPQAGLDALVAAASLAQAQESQQHQGYQYIIPNSSTATGGSPNAGQQKWAAVGPPFMDLGGPAVSQIDSSKIERDHTLMPRCTFPKRMIPREGESEKDYVHRATQKFSIATEHAKIIYRSWSSSDFATYEPKNTKG
jgi:hypothetical protein